MEISNREPKEWLAISAWIAQLSPTTQITYVGIIREYSAFLGATAGTALAAQLICDANPTHALSYLQAIKMQAGQKPRHSRRGGHAAAPATVYKKIMALRRMYQVLEAHGFITKNPMRPELLPLPNPQGGKKRETEMLPFDAVPKLLAAVNDTPRPIRDRAIIALLFGGGLRRAELCKLTLADVARTKGGTTYLVLRKTKDGADALQALPDWAARYAWELVADRKSQGAEKDSPLFVTYAGRGGCRPTSRAMPDCAVYHLFRQACERIGLGPHYTPHSARATAITKLLSDGMPHREVQEFSRHKSVAMVELYDKRRWGVDASPAKGLSFENDDEPTARKRTA